VSALAALATATAFNLFCVGTSVVTLSSGPSPPTKFTNTLRIDLSGGRWCEYDCRVSHAILLQSETQLILSNYPPGSDRGLSVHRETGTYDELLKLGGVTNHRVGQCEVRPFTGLPTRKF